MTTRQFEIYAPLQDFCWNGVDFELTPGIWIKHFNQKPDLQELDTTLAEDEHTDAFFYAQHWLTFHWNEGTEPSPAETVNLALVALWLVKPTRSHVAFRFELGRNAAAGEKSRSRLFDRFAWVTGVTHEEFDDSDLESASSYYPALRDICCAGSRLNDALILTLTGCWSHQWQAALICHAAAAERCLPIPPLGESRAASQPATPVSLKLRELPAMLLTESSARCTRFALISCMAAPIMYSLPSGFHS